MGINKLNMKVFVKDPSSGLTQALYVEDGSLVADLKEQVAQDFDLSAEDLELQYGIQTLQNEDFLGDCGILDKVRCQCTCPLMVVKERERRSNTPPQRRSSTSTPRDQKLSSSTSPLMTPPI